MHTLYMYMYIMIIIHTGVVTGLLGVPSSQVVMGRSHICVLTELGTVYTFGSNQYGQCGRNYVPPPEGVVDFSITFCIMIFLLVCVFVFVCLFVCLMDFGK